MVVSDGDYAQAKKEATRFSEKSGALISIGNIDPLRIEAKRTMAFEFIRQLGKLPDVYMQAVAGGTGPIALDKGVREMKEHGQEIAGSSGVAVAQGVGTPKVVVPGVGTPDMKCPRMLLVQQDLCDPMVQAYEKAKKEGFPEGYENDYPVIENPPTSVFILSAGNPGMYPIVARIVHQSNGDFIRVKEAELVDYARIVRQEKNIHIGMAATVCFAGFYQALREGSIHDGETVVVNIGESGRRYPDFVNSL